MPYPRRYWSTWDDVGVLNSDHLATEGLLDGWSGAVDVGGEGPQTVALAHDATRDVLICVYKWPRLRRVPYPISETIQSDIQIERRPCRLGGTRAFFWCPNCDARCRRLAIHPRGAWCGRCASVVYKSTIETPAARMVRRAWRIAEKLEMESLTEYPRRPASMKEARYRALLDELLPLLDQIGEKVRSKLARARNPGAAWDAIERWGL